MDDPERIKRLLGKTARMNFRMVNETASIDEAMSGRVPPGSDLLFELDPRTGEKTIPYIIYKRIGVSGDQLVDANPSMDQYNQPVVSLRFDSTGSRKFGDLPNLSTIISYSDSRRAKSSRICLSTDIVFLTPFENIFFCLQKLFQAKPL